MAILPKRLVTSQLTNATATYYTAAAGTRTRIDACTAFNGSASTATFDLHLVPNGSSASDTNKIVEGRAVSPGASLVVQEALGHWIEPSGTIQAVASANTAISLVVSGIEQS